MKILCNLSKYSLKFYNFLYVFAYLIQNVSIAKKKVDKKKIEIEVYFGTGLIRGVLFK